MQYPESTVRIPMIDEARSLNLSNSVAIAAYEVLRQWNYPQLQSVRLAQPQMERCCKVIFVFILCRDKC